MKHYSVIYLRIGEYHDIKENYDEAYISYTKGLNILHKSTVPYDCSEDFQRTLAIFYEKLGDLFVERGEMSKSEEYYKKEIDLFERLYKNTKSQSTLYALNIAKSRLKGSNMSVEEGKDNLDQNYLFYEQSRISFAENGNSQDIKHNFAISCERLANNYQKNGMYIASLTFFTEAISLQEELLSKNPRSIKIMNGLANSTFMYGCVLVKIGRVNQGLTNYSRSRKLLEEILTIIVTDTFEKKLETVQYSIDKVPKNKIFKNIYNLKNCFMYWFLALKNFTN